MYVHVRHDLLRKIGREIAHAEFEENRLSWRLYVSILLSQYWYYDETNRYIVEVLQKAGDTVRERRKLGRVVTAIVEREGDGYVALCPEVDVASQGQNVAEARRNLKEALELFFFEAASEEEIERRFQQEVYVTHIEVAVS